MNRASPAATPSSRAETRSGVEHDAGPTPASSAARFGPAAGTPLARAVVPPPALALIAHLERSFRAERKRLLGARANRQQAWDRGEVPGYLPDDECPAARGDWSIRPLPEDLRRRRVEITGPISEPKMVINMLSRTADGARADAAMLDFEDSMKPSWENVTRGLRNLIDAVDGSLAHDKIGPGGEVLKRYRLDPEDMPLLMVRVRGLHLDESNVLVDGRPVSAGLLDLALSAYHTARALAESGRTPKYYVPKVEHYLEARWWDALFSRIEEELDLAPGTLRSTFLIETLPAAYQMEEILYELRGHAAGLNGGRWDKIFSDIKVLMRHPDRVMADRASISMGRSWMRNYALQLIRVCHRHGAFAMGGMAAFTPGSTPEEREAQTRKVVEDKRVEASIGHDGCWVSHPYFIAPAMGPFTRDNQLDVVPADLDDRPDLLPRAEGPRTMDGLRTNVRVGIAYLAGWNADIGCVAWEGLMEDLATLEISRAQVHQWVLHGVALDDGTTATRELVERVFIEETRSILDDLDPDARDSYAAASRDALAIFTEAELRPFLTTRSDPAHWTAAQAREALRDPCVASSRPDPAAQDRSGLAAGQPPREEA